MRHRIRTAAAALACATALSSCASGGPASTTSGAVDTARQDSPAATPAGPDTTIPDDFPLGAGMGGDGVGGVTTVRTGTGLRDLRLCGTTPLRGLGIRDRMVADNSGGEAADTRELVLLGNPDEARLVAEAFRDLGAACGTVDDDRGMSTRTRVLGSPFGDAPAATLVQTYSFDGEPGTGATVIHVVPVGAAVLVTSTYGGWTPGGEAEAVEATVAPLRETVAALTGFTDPEDASEDQDAAASPSSPSSPTNPTASPSGSSSPEVPAGFPLAVDVPEPDADTEVQAPSAEAEGLGEVEACGQVLWPGAARARREGLRRLVTSVVAPEDVEWRELVLHPGAAPAAAEVTRVRDVLAGCTRDGDRVWTLLDSDPGEGLDSVTVGLTYRQGLGSTVFQMTRVGAARLLVASYGEGSLASLDAQADEVTETTGKIVPAMCVFTKTGC